MNDGDIEDEDAEPAHHSAGEEFGVGEDEAEFETTRAAVEGEQKGNSHYSAEDGRDPAVRLRDLDREPANEEDVGGEEEEREEHEEHAALAG